VDGYSAETPNMEDEKIGNPVLHLRDVSIKENVGTINRRKQMCLLISA
jgi:hypothetical protein